MPKFEKQPSNELKQYLNYILSEKNTDIILDSIVNNDTDILWNYVVGYKLIAHNLKKLRIDDPELSYLIGNFLGKYDAIEKLYKKYVDKKKLNNNVDKIIASSAKAVDILSDLYSAPAISTTALTSKYGDSIINEELHVMNSKEVIEPLEKEKECYYMLSDKSRRYMKERYFSYIETEEEKEEKSSDVLRSKTLHLLREENKKEE